MRQIPARPLNTNGATSIEAIKVDHSIFSPLVIKSFGNHDLSHQAAHTSVTLERNVEHHRKADRRNGGEDHILPNANRNSITPIRVAPKSSVPYYADTGSQCQQTGDCPACQSVLMWPLNISATAFINGKPGTAAERWRPSQWWGYC